MRFIHTSDWHLGRLFHGRRLTEDQAYLLDGFYELVKEERPDAVVIAGDIYDRSAPPTEAVALLDETLARLLLDLKTPIFMITGNHDSPERVSFGSRILAGQGLFIAGRAGEALRPVVLEDADGPVEFHLFPYTEPALARCVLNQADLHDHQSVLNYMVTASLQAGYKRNRRIAVAHAFVAGGMECESERPLSVGGSFQVNPEVFAPFAYTALGHLHNPQTAGADKIRYAGSLYKYSFDEAGQTKGIHLISMDASGAVTVETRHLPQLRDVRVIEGEFNEILHNRGCFPASADYISIKLKNIEPIVDVYGRLSEIYPNLMQVERPALTAGTLTGAPVDYRKIGEVELFAAFFQQMTGTALSEEQRSLFACELDEMMQRQREAES